MGTRFRAMIAPINVSTGDERRFQEGSLTHAPLPLPFEWAREKGMGHEGSVTIGRVTSIDIGASEVWAEGELFDDVNPAEMPRLSEDVAEVKLLIEQGVVGPSVDLDEFEGFPVRTGSDDPLTEEDLDEIMNADPGEDLDIELLVTEGRIRAATLVSIPAFVETSGPIELISDDGMDEPLVAAVIGSTDLPVADRGTDWDGAAARNRVFDLCADGDTVDTECVARAFLWRDPDADPETRGAYSLGFADVIDGRLQIVPSGIAATAGGRGVDATDIPAADKDRIKSRICSIYDTVRNQIEDWPECPFERDDEARVASVAAPSRPGVSVFDRPDLTGPTPITYQDGRVYGHIAPREACHEGFTTHCELPPMTGDYSLFHRHPYRTADGGTVLVGRITVGGHHADTKAALSSAMTDYDGKTTAAWVRAGEDQHGIWVSGVMNPDLTDDQLSVLERRKVSADWRGPRENRRLIDVLALSPGPRHLSEPGYPIRANTYALTAALGPSVPVRTVPDAEAIQRIVDGALEQMKAKWLLAEEIRRG